MAASLIMGWTLAAPSAHAGTYTLTYSGGQTVAVGVGTASPGTTVTTLYSANYDGNSNYGGSAGVSWYNRTASVTCSKVITATATWQPSDPNDTPPSSVVVKQVGTARYDGQGFGAATPPGKCADGLGDAEVDTGTSAPQPGPPPTFHGVSTGTRWSGTDSPGASFALSTTPSASVSGTGTDGPPTVSGSGSASVSSAATIYPITINPGGATSDGKGGWCILVGQKCSPALVGIPSGCTASNYNWSVSGTTFQSWTVSSDMFSTTEVDGPGRCDQSTAAWYWNDNLGRGGSKVEQVICTVTLTPPNGQGAAFSVTVTQPVTVWVPKWKSIGTGGAVYVVNTGSTNSPNYWIQADPVLVSEATGGMDWTASVMSPLAPTFGDGSVTMVQLIIPGVYFRAEGVNYYRSNNGQEGLDTQYPYPTNPSSTQSSSYYSNDSPGFSVSYSAAGSEAYSATLKDQFEDFLLYTPPGSTQCVPIGRFVWTTDGSATEPYMNGFYNWSYYGSSSAGSVSPSGTANFVQSNSFPSWTQNSGNGSGYWAQ